MSPILPLSAQELRKLARAVNPEKLQGVPSPLWNLQTPEHSIPDPPAGPQPVLPDPSRRDYQEMRKALHTHAPRGSAAEGNARSRHPWTQP